MPQEEEFNVRALEDEEEVYLSKTDLSNYFISLSNNTNDSLKKDIYTEVASLFLNSAVEDGKDPEDE